MEGAGECAVWCVGAFNYDAELLFGRTIADGRYMPAAASDGSAAAVGAVAADFCRR